MNNNNNARSRSRLRTYNPVRKKMVRSTVVAAATNLIYYILFFVFVIRVIYTSMILS